MPKQVTVTLRGKEYPVKKLSGITALGLIREMFSTENILDPSKIPSTATGLKTLIPDIPDHLISQETINLQPEEFYEFVDDFRDIYFADNLEAVRKIGDYKQEYDYARGWATFKAYRELRVQLREEQRNDWGWDVTSDVRLGIDDAPDHRTWFYFEQYYKEQIQIAESENNSTRVKELQGILSKAKINFDNYTKAKTVNTTVPNGLVESENEALRKELEELKAKQGQPVTVG